MAFFQRHVMVKNERTGEYERVMTSRVGSRARRAARELEKQGKDVKIRRGFLFGNNN